MPVAGNPSNPGTTILRSACSAPPHSHDHLPGLLPAATLTSWTEELGKVVVKYTGPVGATTEALTAPDTEHVVEPSGPVLQPPLELPMKESDTAVVPCCPATAEAAAIIMMAVSHAEVPILLEVYLRTNPGLQLSMLAGAPQ